MIYPEYKKNVEIINTTPTKCAYKAHVEVFKTKKKHEPLDPILIAELLVYDRKDFGNKRVLS